MTAPPGTLRLLAPAKINLYLHVLGKRADGYHRLDSLAAFADIADVLEASPARDLSLVIDGPFADALDDNANGNNNVNGNLVLRAARLLAEETGAAPNAALRLRKNLPVAAGLGGGSSDAAATLRLLVRLWDLPRAEAILPALASGLGADVPMCLLARPVFVGGVGERLGPQPALPETAVVLANPGRPLPTPAVFGRLELRVSRRSRFAGAPRDAARLALLLGHRRNDLTEAASSIEPAIATVLAELAASGALLARMSGSGATCYGLFGDIQSAKAAAARISMKEPGWWVRAGKLLSRCPEISSVA